MTDRRFGGCLRAGLLAVLTCVGASACGETPSDPVELVSTGLTRQALDAPVNTVPPTQVTNEDTRLTFVTGPNELSVLYGDGTQQIQVQITVTNGTFTTGGVQGVVVTGNGSNDVIVTGKGLDVNGALNASYYQPALNFSGSAQLTMNSQDTFDQNNRDIDVTAITVTSFNDPPVLAVPTATVTATEDTPKAVSLTVSDVDIGTGSIRISLNSTNGTVMSLPVATGLTFEEGGSADVSTMTFTGTLTNVNAALNGLTITPSLNYVGSSTVNVVADDQGQSGNGEDGIDNETLTLSWQAVNDPPVNTVPGSQAIDEDGSVSFSSASGTGLSVTDVDAPTTLLQVTLSATNGRLSLGSTGGVSFVNGDGVDDTSFAFTGTLSQLNAALEGTAFAANANFAGTARVTMTTSDLGNSGVGGFKQDSDTIDIVVSGINDRPVNGVPGPQVANEDVALTFGESNRVSVADVDATTLSVTLTASQGTVTLSTKVGLVFFTGDGTADAAMTFTGSLANINSALFNSSFLAIANYYGAASLSISTSDLGASGAGGVLVDEDTVAIDVIAVNDPPSSLNDNYEVAEDSVTTTFDVMANDTFAPDVAESIALESVSAATYGTALLEGGVVRYTPSPNFFGTDTFSYVITDGDLSDTAIVTVNVSAVNDAPVANDDSYTVAQEETVTLSLLSNDSIAPDADETLIIQSVTQPANGSVVIDIGQVTVRYTGNPDSIGEDSFSYTISDGSLTAVAQVSLTVVAVVVVPVNSLPAPQSTVEDLPLVFSNANGNPITVTDNNETLNVDIVVTNGRFRLPTTTGLTVNGNDSSSVSISGPITDINAALNGAVYTPLANFNGSALLTMTSSDNNSNSDADSLNLTVAAANDAPTNTVPGAQSGTEDVPKTFSSISVSDIDVGAGQVRVTLQASNGSLVTLSSSTALDFDAGDGVSDALVTFRGRLADVNAALNGLTVVPAKNSIGSSTLTITSNDLGNVGSGGAKENTDQVTINWAAGNDAPQNLVPPAQETEEDVPLAFSEGNLNALRASDDDAGGAPIQVTLSVTNGTLTLGNPDELTFVTGDGIDDTTVSFQASLAALNGGIGVPGGLEGIAFAPSAGYVGTALLTMTTDDLGNTGGDARSDTDTVTITVVAVNDPPVNVVPSEQAVQEDSTLYFSAATGNAITVTDPDATSLQVSLSGSGGDLSLATVSGLVFQAGDGNNDESMTFRGSASAINTALNGLRFSSTANFNGLASVTIRSDDLGGTGLGGPLAAEDTVEIIVSAVNDAPVVVNDSYTVDEDAAPTAFAVLVNDTTAPDVGETLTITLVTVPNRGGTVTIDGDTVIYQPLADFHGTERFDYTISDGGESATGRVTVTVVSVDDPPNAVDDAISVPRNAIAYLLPVLANDTDPDVDANLLITATTTPAQGLLELDGTGTELRYTAPPAYSGEDTFEYTITDGTGNSDTASVTLTVESGVNAVPVTVDDIVSVSEDSSGLAIAVLANDLGMADTPLVVTVLTEPTNGTVELQADNAALYIPSLDYAGPDQFSYTVTDADGETSSADVYITVTPVDDIPVASADQATSAEDTSVNIAVLANDRGLADAAVTVTLSTSPPFGTATVETDNSITYQPSEHFFGQVIFVYAVSDGEQSSSAAVTVIVTPVADAPEAVTDTVATRPGEAIDIDALANDSDADGDPLHISAFGVPAQGTASLVEGKVRYLPNDTFQGTVELEYTVSDDGDLTDVGIILIAVGLDVDEDGLIDLDELDLGTDPNVADTDADLIADGVEVHITLTDPLDDDSDDDGLLDGNEDVDQDGVLDPGETDPNDFDTDDDLLSDGLERGLSEPQGSGTDEDIFVPDADPSTTTDPTLDDSDDDGVKDGLEDTNRNGRRDSGERNSGVYDSAPVVNLPPEGSGGCNAVPADSVMAALVLLVLLGRLTRRRGRTRSS